MAGQLPLLAQVILEKGGQLDAAGVGHDVDQPDFIVRLCAACPAAPRLHGTSSVLLHEVLQQFVHLLVWVILCPWCRRLLHVQMMGR